LRLLLLWILCVVYVEDDQAVAARFCWLTMLDPQVWLRHALLLPEANSSSSLP
jgi:hypothetical protein